MRQRRLDVVVDSIIADLEVSEKEMNGESKALARINFMLRTN